MEVAHAPTEALPGSQLPPSESHLDLHCCPAHLIRKSHIPGPPSAQDSIPALVHIKKIETAVGRERNAVDVHLDSTRVPRMISRVHSFLVYTHHQWKVRDNRSVNGVFVNDRKVHEAVLLDGDIVIFGGGGNRPIGAVLEQRDWEFKYEFRINHKWNMTTSAEEDSEDDTVDGETSTRRSCDDVHSFDIDGSGQRQAESVEVMLDATPLRQENAKKRKRVEIASYVEQLHGEILNHPQSVSTMDDDTMSIVEWTEETPPKKACLPPHVADSAVPIPYLDEVNVPYVHSPAQGLAVDEAVDPVDDLCDLDAEQCVRQRLMLPIDDPTAEQRLNELQAELHAACEARQASSPAYPYPDESSVQCFACKNLIFNPTTMGCGHSLCDGCVECLVIKSPNCPLCEKPVSAPFQLNIQLQTEVLAIVRQWTQTERHDWLQHMIKRNERIRKAGFDLLLESFLARGIRFINIEDRWSDSERVMFSDRLDMYPTAPRVAFCAAVGLTATWIRNANFEQLLNALGNVGLSIAPLLNRLRTLSAPGSLLVAGDPHSDNLVVETFREALIHFTTTSRRHIQNTAFQLPWQHLAGVAGPPPNHPLPPEAFLHPRNQQGPAQGPHIHNFAQRPPAPQPPPAPQN